MNTNDIIIRLEKKVEYREVEKLVRESFWNVYKPGCSEHYVLHVLICGLVLQICKTHSAFPMAAGQYLF